MNHETNTKTQHEKILDLCADGQFHCQNEFRALFIFSPHKRREEIEKGRYKGGVFGQYKFEHRKCLHGVQGQLDYRMYKPVYERPKPVIIEQDTRLAL